MWLGIPSVGFLHRFSAGSPTDTFIGAAEADAGFHLVAFATVYELDVFFFDFHQA
jgi:hypothetical protein